MSLKTEKHIVSMSLRDPSSVNEMPANTAEFIQTQCIRGCRKVRPQDYIAYVSGANPDIVVAPGDTPFTPPPYSQKRIEKSITRTLTWLTQLSIGLAARPIFSPLMGGTNANARAAFSRGLVESLDVSDWQKLNPGRHITERARGNDEGSVVGLTTVVGTTTTTGPPIERLDETLAGYVLEIAPIQAELRAQLGKQNGVLASLPTTAPSARSHAFATNVLAAPDPLESDILNYVEDIDSRLPELVRSSLDHLSPQKPRLALGLALASPHVMLGLVEQGVDLIDSALAIRCASAGVALDFVLPVVGEHSGEKLDVGHNLYDSRYEQQFVRLSDEFTVATSNNESSDKPICYCATCSPIWETQPIGHSKIDGLTPKEEKAHYAPAYTRAYIHHLLHTHEMSAHTLLTFHNLAVVEAMMTGARSAIENGTFEKEVRLFEARYDGGMRVLREAEKAWRGVDRARGKGRLAREKAEKEQYALEE
ncbi:unnamed protein product [Rhizoctonia solani]|uniref:tRNA-guanine(15) transglycosylase-like domain-containing protein n=1 Tax=Rhizoctonia solani TaxID=456999 RepID=A0A8H3DG28_9AGAM|nr:unnamed protein product [Rhizoctonia solani]